MLSRLLRKLEVDRAVSYAALLRFWQLAAGAVSVLLIARFFTRETQGVYYTFASLVALQSVFELGFFIVVTNVSSHEWAKLKIDDAGRIAGDAAALSRLVSLGRLVFRWYGVASLLFVVAIGAGGLVFFSRGAEHSAGWREPWMALVALSGLLLWTLPFNALLEGCDQVAAVNRFRLLQAVVANIAVWTSIALGAGLWALVAATAARLLCDLYLLLVRYGRFFRPFWQPPTADRVQWTSEVWPMQWRIGVSSVFAYCEFALFTPVMFYYHGEVVAGQMGMTWVLVTALQAAALAWVQTRVPKFGMLIAQRDFQQLDHMFFRLTMISFAVIAAGGAALWGLVQVLHVLEAPLAGRLLDPTTTAVFILGVVMYQIPHCLVFYLRAHKREPLLVLKVVTSLSIGAAIILGGRRFGPLGAAAGYCGVITLFVLPAYTVLWQRCRARWHV